jgi:DNA-binding NarL/FixJ family response regulator
VEVAQKGELVAPRELLRHLVAMNQDKAPDVGGLSPRQREVLVLAAEDLSNAEIAGRLYLSESTVKQHLRAAYKLLGVRNRTEAAKMLKAHERDL